MQRNDVVWEKLEKLGVSNGNLKIRKRSSCECQNEFTCEGIEDGHSEDCFEIINKPQMNIIDFITDNTQQTYKEIQKNRLWSEFVFDHECKDNLRKESEVTPNAKVKPQLDIMASTFLDFNFELNNKFRTNKRKTERRKTNKLMAVHRGQSLENIDSGFLETSTLMTGRVVNYSKTADMIFEYLKDDSNKKKTESDTISVQIDRLNILFFNTMNSSKAKDLIHLRLKDHFAECLKILVKLVLCNWHFVTNIVVVIYCLFDPSMITALLLAFVIIFGFTEFQNHTLNYLTFIYFYIFAIIIMKAGLSTLFNNKKNIFTGGDRILIELSTNGYSLIEMIFGSMEYHIGGFISLIFIILATLYNLYNGLSKKTYSDYENIYDAFLRMKMNEKFTELSKADYEEQDEYLNLLTGLNKVKKACTQSITKKIRHYSSEKFTKLIEETKRENFDKNRFLDIIKSIETHMIETL